MGTSSAFPPKPFGLSARDASAITALSDRVLAETLSASIQFSSHGRVADPRSWKIIKEKGSFTVYQETKSRRPSRRERLWSETTDAVSVSPQTPSFFATGNNSSEDLNKAALADLDQDDGEESKTTWVNQEFGRFAGSHGDDGPGSSVLEQFRPDHTPLVISSGTFPGTIEDMGLGFLADTDDRSRMRFNTKKQVIVDDMRILAQIKGPTQDDPFRFLGIKWCAHLPSRVVAFVVKPRDYVVIESTGMSIDSNGQRFSYMLNHSIELDEVPDFRKFNQVRIAFSTCHIMRMCQGADGADCVELFSRGFMDAGGRYAARIATSQFAEGLLMIPGIMEEAYLKKLTWLFYTKRLRLRSGSVSSGSIGSASSGSDSLAGSVGLRFSSSCTCCTAKLSPKLGGLVERSAVCSLCRQTVCYACKVKKSLPVAAAPGRQLSKKDLYFCMGCFLQARRLPARHVAMASIGTNSI